MWKIIIETLNVLLCHRIVLMSFVDKPGKMKTLFISKLIPPRKRSKYEYCNCNENRPEMYFKCKPETPLFEKLNMKIST